MNPIIAALTQEQWNAVGEMVKEQRKDARDAALEEAAIVAHREWDVADRSRADADTSTPHGKKAYSMAEAAADRAARIRDDIRALKSKPAQEGPVLEPHPAASIMAWPRPSEMASEENGLLPKKRRREHEYGEEKNSMFGAVVAECTHAGCRAYRVRTRDRKRVQFHQRQGRPPTDEPGPCEVEP